MSAATLAQLRAGALRGTVRLDLSAGLAVVPPEVLTLADSLEILNLSGNQLTSLPDWLPELPRLRVLFCSDNPFEVVPGVLGRCPALEMVGFKACRLTHFPAAALPEQLRWLILTDNRLEELPAETGGCARLQKLMLSGNRLTRLPAELARCSRLELLRLAANQFSSLPAWLWDIPSLAWLAVAGNPCTPLAAAPAAGFLEIPWRELTVGALLGEGASGVIHQAAWQPDGDAAARQVAVKLFKGAMTSDGLPESEMAACLAVGEHPHLIGACGRITGHPGAANGLVMPLIDPGSQSLAGPPSLETCTRDEYPADRRFTAPAALRLIRSLAAAACHLHARGLLHGDLYAHNVLHDASGSALLGDFGAASFYPPGPADRIQRMEVRAFGILAGEVLSRCTEPGLLPPFLPALVESCTQPDVAARPDFRAIMDALGAA